MSGILFAHGDHCHSVGAAFWGQVEINNFRELFLQQRDKDLVEGHAKHRWFVWRSPRVGAVVNRLVAGRHGLNRKHGKFFDLVVITCVIAKWALFRLFRRIDVALEYDLCMGGNPQLVVPAALGQALCDLSLAAPQQAGKGIFRKGIRHRCHGPQRCGWVCSQRYGNGIGLIGALQGPVPEIQSAASVREPTHDQFAWAETLHAVNAEVHAGLFGTSGDDQGPGDQRSHVSRPAGLYRNTREVNVVTGDYPFLTGRLAHSLGPHVKHLLEQRGFINEVAHAFGWIGLA